MDQYGYGYWNLVVWNVILFGFFLLFIPFKRRIERLPGSIYLAFIIALYAEMYGLARAMLRQVNHSPSMAEVLAERAFLKEFGGYLNRKMIVAVIGSLTQKTLEELGVKVDVAPEEYTVEAMIETLVNYFKIENTQYHFVKPL